ncbi:sulfatase-like hydrolase/transferase [Gimesia fumaroli]|uniref:Arylsulfatase n=1 Tax=Gimesia fumaroli TaxID=2527976 RepID=A0A518IK10_9PLAN|nr:sulfatase-like hydrolase/transferase [Gimesia fumaroli]QDV53433.1 Arylsulfatase [Gimesia fumaroli]
MTTSRRNLFLAVLVLAGLCLPLNRSEADTQTKSRPNILFLFSDDQRADAIAAYDNPHIQTPNLDTLVKTGFSFRNAFCMGSIHGAVCQPSRAMLNSGRTLYHVPMDLKGVITLPQLLKQAGYTTFGTGKWHNQRDSFQKSFTTGTAAFIGGMSNHLKVPVVDLKNGKFQNKRQGAKFSSELFVDAAVDFLKQQPKDKPFYAYVAFTAPHDPRMPPASAMKPYQNAQPPLPKNFKPQHPFNNGWMTGRDEALTGWPRQPEIIREQLAEYYGMITDMDSHIGRILNTLKDKGFDKNTIVVFSSDHGLALGSHGLLGKQNLYEHSMKAPLIFKGPGIPQNKSTDALVYLYDIFPTVCDLTHITVPPGVEGSDLAPIWRGKTDRVRDSLFTTYEDLMRAVRDDRWKLIRYPQINKTQLFDLKEDPHELQDLSQNPGQKERVQKMLAQLKDWQKKTDDKQPLTSDHPKPENIDLTGRKRKPDQHQPDWIVKKYFDSE